MMMTIYRLCLLGRCRPYTRELNPNANIKYDRPHSFDVSEIF